MQFAPFAKIDMHVLIPASRPRSNYQLKVTVALHFTADIPVLCQVHRQASLTDSLSGSGQHADPSGCDVVAEQIEAAPRSAACDAEAMVGRRVVLPDWSASLSPMSEPVNVTTEPPCVGDAVQVRRHDGSTAAGTLIEDFADYALTGDAVGRDWAMPHRWAVALGEGTLIFVDDADIHHGRDHDHWHQFRDEVARNYARLEHGRSRSTP